MLMNGEKAVCDPPKKIICSLLVGSFDRMYCSFGFALVVFSNVNSPSSYGCLRSFAILIYKKKRSEEHKLMCITNFRTLFDFF